MLIRSRRLRTPADDGATLAELAIVAALFMAVLGGTLQVFNSGLQTHRRHDARSKVIEDVGVAMDRLTKDVRQALSVDPSSMASRLDIQTFVRGAPHRVVYDVTDGALRRTVDDGSPVPLAAGVLSADVFTYDNSPATAIPTLIRIAVRLGADSSGVRPVVLSTRVHLRNAAGGAS